LKRSHISKVGEVLEMSDDELLKIRNFGDKSLAELKEKLAEHGVTDLPDPAEAAVPDIAPDDLGELMGDEREDADLPSEAPGMSIDGTGDAPAADDGDTDTDQAEDED
jgi:hypothetical protein